MLDCQGGNHTKIHNTMPTHVHVKFFLIHFLVTGGAGVYLQHEESWYVLKNTQIYPTGLSFNILPQAVQRKHFFTSTVSALAGLRQTKELLTCVCSQTPEARVTAGEHTSPGANTQLPSKHSCPKKTHSSGEAANQQVSFSRYDFCILKWTHWYCIWEQVKIRAQSGWKHYPFRAAHALLLLTCL